MLYEKALQVAQSVKASFVWLKVWEKHGRALSFYKKNGFISFGEHVYQLGDDAQTDIMMKLAF